MKIKGFGENNKNYKSKNNIGLVHYGEDKQCLAKCRPLKKFDLQTNSWNVVEDNQKGKAFSIATYDRFFGSRSQDENEPVEYYIIGTGMRPENYSKTGKAGSTEGWGVSEIVTELDKQPKKIKLLTVLLDIDAPIDRESIVLAKMIDKFKSKQECKKVNVLGISKCGIMNVQALKYLNQDNLDKINITNYSAPYLGTIMASPEKLYKRADEIAETIPNPSMLLKKVVINLLNIINSKEKKKEIKSNSGNNLSKLAKGIYWRLFSQSHMDYDVSTIDGQGVAEEHKDRYDANLLRNLFDEKTLSMLRRIEFTNITTITNEETLNAALKKRDLSAAGLYLSDKLLFPDELSDGVVPLKSAKHIENICQENDIQINTRQITGGHHDIAASGWIIKEVVGIGNEKQIER